MAISVKFNGRLRFAPFRENYAKKNLAGMEMDVAGDCSCRQYVAKRRNPRSLAKMRWMDMTWKQPSIAGFCSEAWSAMITALSSAMSPDLHPNRR